MDPDACWAEALALAERIQSVEYEGSAQAMSAARVADAERLSELVTSLDEWLKKGGFPPAAFQPKT